jgi:hypothetical protein
MADEEQIPTYPSYPTEPTAPTPPPAWPPSTWPPSTIPPWGMEPEASPEPPRRRRVSLWLVLAFVLCAGALVGAIAYSSHATKQRRAALAAVATATSRLDRQRRDTRVADSSLHQTAALGRAQIGSTTAPMSMLQQISDGTSHLATNEGQLIHDGEASAGAEAWNSDASQANHDIDDLRALFDRLGRLAPRFVA